MNATDQLKQLVQHFSATVRAYSKQDWSEGSRDGGYPFTEWCVELNSGTPPGEQRRFKGQTMEAAINAAWKHYFRVNYNIERIR